jgi:leucyl-tRNA---protein transferase
MKAFVNTVFPIKLSPEEFDAYMAKGFFPSGEALQALSHLIKQIMWAIDVKKVYRMRFAIDEIVLHKSHQRVRKQNNKFIVKIETFNEILEEHNNLYQKYLGYIKFSCASTLLENLEVNKTEESAFNRIAISVYDQDKIVALDILYAGAESLASVLCFYDPEYADYSLGKYTMLLAIDYMKLNSYKYYYIGYLVNGDSKFDYKLYLGAESAYVYNNDSDIWDKFDPAILIPIEYSESEKMDIFLEIMGIYGA